MIERDFPPPKKLSGSRSRIEEMPNQTLPPSVAVDPPERKVEQQKCRTDQHLNRPASHVIHSIVKSCIGIPNGGAHKDLATTIGPHRLIANSSSACRNRLPDAGFGTPNEASVTTFKPQEQIEVLAPRRPESRVERLRIGEAGGAAPERRRGADRETVGLPFAPARIREPEGRSSERVKRPPAGIQSGADPAAKRGRTGPPRPSSAPARSSVSTR